MRSASPIFIVGVPRSGTTLLAAMLGAHSRLSCGPETHVLGDLEHDPLGRKTLLRSSRELRTDWPASGLRLLQSVKHLGQPVTSNYGFSEEEVREYLSLRPPNMQSIVSALPDILREKCGKARWVEKTPDHLPHVQKIRALFPDSPIVRIVRDPRDVAVSLERMPWGPRSFLGSIAFWRTYDAASDPFFQRDDRCLTVRYEDLVNRPEESLERICELIKEAFETRMLNTEMSAKYVNRTQEPWKVAVAGKVNASRIGVWHTELTDEENLVAEAILGHRLAAFGYEVANHFRAFGAIYPSEVLFEDKQLALAVAQQRIRLWAAERSERPGVQVFIGDPDNAPWFRGGTWGRAVGLLHVVSALAWSLLFRRQILWLRKPEVSQRGSKCARIASLLIRGSGYAR